MDSCSTKWSLPGNCCREHVDAACHLECSFCWVELTGSLEALECCRGTWSLVLLCRMLGYTGNSCWRMPSIYLYRMSLVVVVFLVEELILYIELMWKLVVHVETLGVLVGCWILCGNTVLKDRLKYLSFDLLSPLLWK